MAQATAPAFLLGALAAFLAILIGRLNRIIDRSKVNPGEMAHLKVRASLISHAIFWAVASSIATALLLIVAFVIAFYKPAFRCMTAQVLLLAPI